MSKSEWKFSIWFIATIIGAIGLFPSKNSLIVNLVVENLDPTMIFYDGIVFGIISFYILVPIGVIISLKKLINYGVLYNVFGLRDLAKKLSSK